MGSTPRQQPPAIWLPPSHKIHGKKPKYLCTLCPMVFYEGEESLYERHVIRGHSHEELREHSLQAQAPGIFDPNHESGDVEWGRWIERNNRERPEQWRKWMRTDEGKS